LCEGCPQHRAPPIQRWHLKAQRRSRLSPPTYEPNLEPEESDRCDDEYRRFDSLEQREPVSRLIRQEDSDSLGVQAISNAWFVGDSGASTHSAAVRGRRYVSQPSEIGLRAGQESPVALRPPRGQLDQF
jgi:hypothetical protein